MAIPYSVPRNLIMSALDAEDSERYTDNADIIPAMNYAQEYVVLAFNNIFAQKKLSEEVLKELTYVKIWRPSIYNRIAFDPTIVGMNLWTIIAVYPKCTAKYIVLPVSTTESVYISDASYISSDYTAKRLTLEEWNERKRNVFVAGSDYQTCPDLIQYAWVNFANYTGGYILANNPFEIEISPSVVNELVAIAFLKKPPVITTIAAVLPFPDTLTTLIVSKALDFISFKQSGGTQHPLFDVSALETKNIIGLLT